jgi:1-deoxy-D-xylulose-5-phosphate synthase
MVKLLDKIDSPDDLKKLRTSKLPQLAQEIRELIIKTVSKTGGHLASNLGVVELTIALHYAFDFSRDRIVWDVGHQTYTHKLLTGRRKKFHTLRQYKGISGFPRIEESSYDHFNTGHSATSISSAVGMAIARDYKKADYHVIAVIGDGSIGAGIALEGINQAGYLRRQLIVIVNDNEMSISPNVGAISGYLQRIISGQSYLKLKNYIIKVMEAIPAIGSQMVKLARILEETIKRILVPGMLFEELGFQYVGPINGHNMEKLIETFHHIKDFRRPVLVHVVTKKGKGYKPAEASPTRFHGASPFMIANGKFIKKKGTAPTFSQVFGDTMIELAKHDKRIVCITAAMPDGTGLAPFAQKFPDRFFDVGICEQHGITFAASLALEGFKPVAAIYSTFLQRALDQVCHDVCLMDIPVIIAMDRAGIVGDDGPTHHGLYDLSYLRFLPNIIIMAPKDENELRHMLKTALECKHPIAIRYPRGAGVGVKFDKELVPYPIGKAEILKQGKDAVILAIGSMVYPSLKAANILAKEGIEIAVVNSRFVKPLDKDLILNITSQCGKIITIEENCIIGGFGSAIMELLESNSLSNTKVLRIGLPDCIVPQGDTNLLHKNYGLTPEKIAQRVSSFIKGNKPK